MADLNVPFFGLMPDSPELPSLAILEPFGWNFAPVSPPPGAVTSSAALAAAAIPANGLPDTEISIIFGAYTEKGRYRQEKGERRVTLYLEHPVWVVTIVLKETAHPADQVPAAEWYSRHTLVDARTGRLITQFLWRNEPGELAVLDLQAPLAASELTRDQAVKAALAGEERVLTGLPRTAEYGSRWRLIPGFVQVTDVWRVTFDTLSLPPIAPTAEPEIGWVVMVDDKAGHRWFSAALQEGSATDDRAV